MDSSELYKTAYSLHYNDNEYDVAIEKYQELIDKFPDSKEASWAKTQIGNIGNLTPLEKSKAERARLSRLEERPDIEFTQPKFQSATGIGKTISAIGWILVALLITGSIFVFATEREPANLLNVTILLIGILLGFIIVANGQLLQAVVSIENNSDCLAQLLEMVLRKKEKVTPS